MGPREDAPEITEEDREILEHPEDGFDPDGPPEEIDREQQIQAEVAERDKAWIDPREKGGREADPTQPTERPSVGPEPEDRRRGDETIPRAGRASRYHRELLHGWEDSAWAGEPDDLRCQ